MAAINQVGNSLTGLTGTGAFVGSINPAINNVTQGLTSTVTATGTTTLTVSSNYQQYFTGTAIQNVDMPVTSTLTVGQSWLIVNNSTLVVTVRSSGGNNILAMPSGTNALITCIAQAGTTAADWNAEGVSGVAGVDSITGTANQVTASSPTGAVTLSLPATVRIDTSILDSNSNTMLAFLPTATAVNYIGFSNNATTSSPVIVSRGADTNVGMTIQTQGTGPYGIQTEGTVNQITVNTGSGYQHATNLSFPSSAANRTVTFPDADGTVALSGASQAVTFASVNFGGSTLSTYVVGSWTPTDASGAALSLTTSAGYTQIGNIIFAYAQVTYPATADGSIAQIGGLPVASANTAYAKQGMMTISTGATAKFIQVNQNATTISPLTAAAGTVTNAQMSSTTIVFTIIYPIS